MDVGPCGNLERELAYENHSSAEKHANEVWEKAESDVKMGRAIVVVRRLLQLSRLHLNGQERRRAGEERVSKGQEESGT